MIERSVLVGVFQDQTQARSAIDELRRAGYNDDEIGFLTRARVEETPEAGREALGAAESNAAAGAMTGGAIGGVLGAAASLLIPGFGPAIAGGILAATFGGIVGGAALGAAAGLIGSLTSMGVPEAEAHYYQQQLQAGHVVVTVKSPGNDAEAYAILERYGALRAKREKDIYNPTNLPRAEHTFGEPPETAGAEDEDQ